MAGSIGPLMSIRVLCTLTGTSYSVAITHFIESVTVLLLSEIKRYGVLGSKLGCGCTFRMILLSNIVTIVSSNYNRIN